VRLTNLIFYHSSYLFYGDSAETACLLAGTAFYAFFGINYVGFSNFAADGSNGTYPDACGTAAAQFRLNEIGQKVLTYPGRAPLIPDVSFIFFPKVPECS